MANLEIVLPREGEQLTTGDTVKAQAVYSRGKAPDGLKLLEKYQGKRSFDPIQDAEQNGNVITADWQIREGITEEISVWLKATAPNGTESKEVKYSVVPAKVEESA